MHQVSKVLLFYTAKFAWTGCVVWSHCSFQSGCKCCAYHLPCWALSWCQEQAVEGLMWSCTDACFTGSDPRALPTDCSRNLVLCSVCASSASVFGMVPNNEKALMSDFSDMWFLFIYSYHGELDHLSVNHHHSWFLGFALLKVSLPAIP